MRTGLFGIHETKSPQFLPLPYTSDKGGFKEKPRKFPSFSSFGAKNFSGLSVVTTICEYRQKNGQSGGSRLIVC
jgi:hypothetical protein